MDTPKRWDAGLTDNQKQIRRLRATLWNKSHREMINTGNRHATPDQRMRRNDVALAWRASRPWYSSWQAARQRCTNQKHKSYPSHGGRGIRFELTKDDMAAIWARDWTPEMETPTLNRIDNEGNYSLANCQLIPLRDNLSAKASLHWTPTQRAAASHGRAPAKSA